MYTELFKERGSGQYTEKNGTKNADRVFRKRKKQTKYLRKSKRRLLMKKKGIAKRIVALSLAASLTAGLFPVQYPLYLGRTSGVVMAASETIVEAFSADQADEGLAADSHFSWPSSVTIDPNSKTFSVDGESVTVSKRMKLGNVMMLFFTW